MINSLDNDGLLEYVEEVGKIPMFSINDLGRIIYILESYGYICYISSDTNYLIVEGD